jgi:hypothetical protein
MNPRLLSYRLKLVQYTDMEVIWTEGKSHLIADALSRNPIFYPPEDSGDHMALCYGVKPKDPLLCNKRSAVIHVSNVNLAIILAATILSSH